MIQIQNFVFNPFLENTYVLHDETKEAIVIDPGCYEDHERQELVDYIEHHELKVVSLLNTHCHIDHVLGNSFVKRQFGVSLWIHAEDEATLKSVEVYAPAYGFAHFEACEAEKFLMEGEQVHFGNSILDIRYTPGHAPGHVVFLNEAENICIGGDVLFDGSIGRTDLPGGDFDTLINSIHSQLFTLNEAMVVYPGHGGTTTIGKEKVSNPFCAINR